MKKKKKSAKTKVLDKKYFDSFARTLKGDVLKELMKEKAREKKL